MRFRTLLLAFVLTSSAAHAQTLNVLGVTPGINASNVGPGQAIVVDFDRAVNAATLPPNAPHLHVFGSISGVIAGSLVLENSDQRLRFTPQRAYAAGETISVELDRFVVAQDGSQMRLGGWSWSFRVRAGSSLRTFEVISVMSTATAPGSPSIVYGGATSDYTHDGFVDIGAVCESTDDVRVFRNKADGTGEFFPFAQPTYAVGSTPSPNEHADINGDGETDLVTCNTGGASVSVLLGNGDGTFQPRTDWTVGNDPHGMGVLDVDGDGYPDIVTANNGSNNVAVILNNGSGGFGAPTFFDSGGVNEYGLCVADMNNDGLMDVVIGARASSEIIVCLNDGAGGFVPQTPQSAGGMPWQLQAGDLNGDGKMDITCANGNSGTAASLLGNGDGTLQPPQVINTNSHTVATDLGDLDGDGDLDWVISCYSAGTFLVYINDGAGGFTYDQTLNAISNSSCAALVDIDNDRDLDILLFEETGDWIQVVRNVDRPIQVICRPGLDGVIACPCSNPPSGASRGCDNSSGTGGASIAGVGDPSLANDTLSLSTANERPTAPSILLQGNAVLPAGAVFGQGVRCAGGTLKRMYVKTAVNGSIVAPAAGDLSLSARSAALGSVITAGQHRWYAVYYRDPIILGGCPVSSGFNSTPTLKVSWVP